MGQVIVASEPKEYQVQAQSPPFLSNRQPKEGFAHADRTKFSQRPQTSQETKNVGRQPLEKKKPNA
jgi:hypothetical protein